MNLKIYVGNQQDCGIGGALFTFPLRNNNFIAIHGQKYLNGAFGIQLKGGKTLVEFKAKEAILRS